MTETVKQQLQHLRARGYRNIRVDNPLDPDFFACFTKDMDGEAALIRYAIDCEEPVFHGHDLFGFNRYCNAAIPQKGRFGNAVIDYPMILKKGLGGILDEIDTLRAEADEEALAFYDAIGEIFGLEAPTCKEIAKGDATVYTVYNGETLIGYCVESASAGFGGDVALMVGYGADRALLGVSVIAHSETPGLGAKVAESAFLDQFKGQSGALVLGEGVDAVSGATISSRAVTNAVNLATEALETALSESSLDTICASRGLRVRFSCDQVKFSLLA